MNSKARDVDRCSVLPKAGLKDFLQDASFVPHLYINILNIIKYYIIIRCSSTRHFEVVGCWPKMAWDVLHLMSCQSSVAGCWPWWVRLVTGDCNWDSRPVRTHYDVVPHWTYWNLRWTRRWSSKLLIGFCVMCPALCHRSHLGHIGTRSMGIWHPAI